MPEVVRGSLVLDRAAFSQPIAHSESGPAAISPTSPTERPRVTFDQNREDTSNSLPTVQTFSPPPRRTVSIRRHSSHNQRRTRDLNEEERDAYYDSRAATQREFRRRGSTLQSYYHQHPELLPQLPFTFRHGFKRWKLAGYISLMVFDACVVPILLYYSMTYGGNIQGYITFAVITAIWGGPTYVEFAVRSIRLIKKKRFFKPLGANQKWAFDITNWILVLTIAVVTTLLIVGAAPHIVFLRVLSMPGPAILYCIAGPIFLMSLYSACGWKAPFRISSTAKGEKVHPGIFYIVEDIVAVNAGGGRPFREGWAARYNASPVFRKMIRDQSWFWSIPALVVAVGCTVAVCIHPVPKVVVYAVGWAVPFIWAGIWAAITVPWIKSVMKYERKSWEEDATILGEAHKEIDPSQTSILGAKPDEEANTPREPMHDRPESSSPLSEGMATTV
ncbi:hypothetical protein LARI1_G008152 [Lachnellula arida]|uniref:Uncharacterized protein n=1 Tax=Lachnellula arida TaxID=1316785 RepID=A0A8T9B7L2_9HELO|nr:hypothetical protein LARI1_G008152 [Lachnellula arida]